MKKSLIAVCAGAPLLALGLGAPTAWAAPEDPHGATVNINGDIKHTSAGSTATATPGGKAIAVNGSQAAAVDTTGSIALAVNGSSANTQYGTDNSVKAINHSVAGAGAFADGDRESSGNTATAINNSDAFAGSILDGSGPSSDNTAIAISGGSATATLGGQTVKCHGTSCKSS